MGSRFRAGFDFATTRSSSPGFSFLYQPLRHGLRVVIWLEMAIRKHRFQWNGATILPVLDCVYSDFVWLLDLA